MTQRVYIETELGKRNPFHIQLSYLRGKSDGGMRALSAVQYGGDENKGFPIEDMIYVGLILDPPLSRASQRKAYVRVLYNNDNNKEQQQQEVSFEMWPDNMEQRSLENRYQYRVAETHALRLSGSDQVQVVEFVLHNVQLDKTKSDAPTLGLLVDCTRWMQTQAGSEERLQSPQYYPADMEVMASLKKVRIEDVPQRTPYWFKARADVTGTKAYKFCGFMQDKAGGFDAEALRRMRYGRLVEDPVCALYLQHTQAHVRVQLVGLVPVRGMPGWSASPDGIVHDSQMSWEHVPQSCRQAYEGSPQVDITRGALEIKCSQKNCNMQDYYYPQLYLEMMAIGAVWADLVRFCERTASDGRGNWKKVYEARVYRIYRHAPTEKILIKCITKALHVHEKMQRQLWRTAEYTSLRDLFKKLAENTAYQKLQVDSNIITSFKRFVDERQQVPAFPQGILLQVEKKQRKKRETKDPVESDYVRALAREAQTILDAVRKNTV